MVRFLQQNDEEKLYKYMYLTLKCKYSVYVSYNRGLGLLSKTMYRTIPQTYL